MNMQNLLYTLCIIIFIINVMYFKKRENKWRTAIIGMGSGVAALIPLHFLLQMSGIMLAINYFTILVSMVLGIPGVILMIIYTVLF